MNLLQHGVPWSQSPDASETTEAVSLPNNGANGLPLLRVSRLLWEIYIIYFSVFHFENFINSEASLKSFWNIEIFMQVSACVSLEY